MAEKEGLPAYCFGGIVSWHTIRIIPIIYFALVWVLAIKSTTALFSQFNFSSDWWMGRLIYPSLSLIFVYLSCFPMFVAPLFFLSLFLFNFSLSLFFFYSLPRFYPTPSRLSPLLIFLTTVARVKFLPLHLFTCTLVGDSRTQSKLLTIIITLNPQLCHYTRYETRWSDEKLQYNARLDILM